MKSIGFFRLLIKDKTLMLHCFLLAPNILYQAHCLLVLSWDLSIVHGLSMLEFVLASHDKYPCTKQLQRLSFCFVTSCSYILFSRVSTRGLRLYWIHLDLCVSHQLGCSFSASFNSFCRAWFHVHFLVHAGEEIDRIAVFLSILLVAASSHGSHQPVLRPSSSAALFVIFSLPFILPDHLYSVDCPCSDLFVVVSGMYAIVF